MTIRAHIVLVACVLLAASVSAFYSKTDVVELTPKDFDAQVLSSEDVWIVEFYAPWCGHCKRLTPEWISAAKQLKGSAVHLAAVDADKHRELGSRFGVEGFPTIKIFGADKKKPRDYEGGRTASDIVAAAKNEEKRLNIFRETGKDAPLPEDQRAKPPPAPGFYDGTDVVELTDETFESEVINGKDAWLIEFYAPWCGHCIGAKPEYIKAAKELAGTFKYGAVDATAHRKYSEKYGVQGFPTFKFFAPGAADAPEEYNGGRTAEAFVQFGLAKAELYPSAPPVVSQVADNAALEALCKDKLMCVIFVVQHVADVGAAGRNAQIEMFVSLMRKFCARKVAFGWIQGGDHTRFEEGFGIYSTYPTFVAFNAQNKRAATHKGSFSEEALSASITRILSGRKAGLTQLKELPKLSSDVPLWDGKDYAPPADE